MFLMRWINGTGEQWRPEGVVTDRPIYGPEDCEAEWRQTRPHQRQH